VSFNHSPLCFIPQHEGFIKNYEFVNKLINLRQILNYNKTMIKIKQLLFVLIILLSACNTNQKLCDYQGKKILFLGNSITYGGTYISNLESYLRLADKNFEAQFINLGLPSETVSQLSEEGHAAGAFPRPALQERMSRLLENIEPDYVFACYGMNDGIYKPFSEERFKKFREGIDWMVNSFDRNKTKVILMSPAEYDGDKNFYVDVLDKYSNWLKLYSVKHNLDYIDLHFPMKSYLREQRKNNPEFKFANDGIHPNADGHWLMSKQIIKYMGFDVTKYDKYNAAVNKFKNSKELTKLVNERQWMMKNAWLSHVGHKRPRMPKGMNFEDAVRKYVEIENQIKKLSHE
jgi:lysophospholipase L1-like esterase